MHLTVPGHRRPAQGAKRPDGGGELEHPTPAAVITGMATAPSLYADQLGTVVEDLFREVVDQGVTARHGLEGARQHG
jgi:hypothetical protein